MIPKAAQVAAVLSYEAALDRIEAIMDAKPGTPEMDELEALTLMVETYEDEHYPMDRPAPMFAVAAS